jgi:hypothetical protein
MPSSSSTSDEGGAAELKLEALKFEREKWLADLGFRQSELELRKRDQGNKDRELLLKETEHRASIWRNPVAVAIFAAAVAALGNAGVAIVNGVLQRGLDERKRTAEIALEQSKAESTRILEMIKTGDPERAAANLQFLLQAGLIADRTLSANLKTFLENRKPGDGPSLPSPGGRLGFEKSEFLTETVRQALQDSLGRYFEFLDRIGFPKPSRGVTVAIDSTDMLNAYYVDNRIIIGRRLVEDTSVALREYNHHMLMAGKNREWRGPFGAIESGLADYFACSFLDNPNLGEKAGQLFEPKMPFIRSLVNKKSHADLGRYDDVDFIYSGAEVVGGFLWGIRERLGPAIADSMIAATWLSYQIPESEDRIFAAFVGALVAAAQAKGPAEVDAVKASAAAKKLPLQ